MSSPAIAKCPVTRLTMAGAIALFAANAQADTPPGTNWIPDTELSDEFNGAELDLRKWQTRNPYYAGKPPGFYSAQNVRVRDGMLELWVRAAAEEKPPAGYGNVRVAYVSSRKMLHYGYIEVRAKPMAAHIDCGFWLYRWTEQGTYEIDVFEIGAGSAGHETKIHTNLHYYVGKPELENDNNRHSAPYTHDAAKPLAREFHTYGLQWTASELRFYFDDRLIRSVPNTHWQQPMSIRFATETQSDWFGLPRGEELPAVFQIDYLRVWREQGQERTH